VCVCVCVCVCSACVLSLCASRVPPHKQCRPHMRLSHRVGHPCSSRGATPIPTLAFHGSLDGRLTGVATLKEVGFALVSYVLTYRGRQRAGRRVGGCRWHGPAGMQARTHACKRAGMPARAGPRPCPVARGSLCVHAQCLRPPSTRGLAHLQPPPAVAPPGLSRTLCLPPRSLTSGGLSAPDRPPRPPFAVLHDTAAAPGGYIRLLKLWETGLGHWRAGARPSTCRQWCFGLQSNHECPSGGNLGSRLGPRLGAPGYRPCRPGRGEVN